MKATREHMLWRLVKSGSVVEARVRTRRNGHQPRLVVNRRLLRAQTFDDGDVCALVALATLKWCPR
jgi:hypothetical protein